MNDSREHYLILNTIMIAACIVGIAIHVLTPAEMPGPVTVGGVPDPNQMYPYYEYLDAVSQVESFEGPYDQQAIDRLIDWTGKMSPDQTPKNKLRAASAADDRSREMINVALTAKLYGQCEEIRSGNVSGNEYQTLQVSAGLLAEQEIPEVLNVLINCSPNRNYYDGRDPKRFRRSYSSGPSADFANSVLRIFGSRSGPILVKKYETARPDLRHLIISMIVEIDGANTVKDLRSLRYWENDPELRRILTDQIKDRSRR